ncbi:MAG: hypothetical protein P4L84_20785 [Isosphaeraceae bacterium]|nr:hypothetical protein [Isosphaeraceae bacterium]
MDALCEALRGKFHRRAKALAALVRVARLLGPCPRWQEAAVARRNVSSERFAQVDDDLGEAVNPDPYLALRRRPVRRGANRTDGYTSAFSSRSPRFACCGGCWAS